MISDNTSTRQDSPDIREISTERLQVMLRSKKATIGLKRALACALIISTCKGIERLKKTNHPALHHHGMRKIVASEREIKRLLGRQECVSYFGI